MKMNKTTLTILVVRLHVIRCLEIARWSERPPCYFLSLVSSEGCVVQPVPGTSTLESNHPIYLNTSAYRISYLHQPRYRYLQFDSGLGKLQRAKMDKFAAFGKGFGNIGYVGVFFFVVRLGRGMDKKDEGD